MRLSVALFIAFGVIIAAAVWCLGQNNGGRPGIPLNSVAQGTLIIDENYEGSNPPAPTCYDLGSWAVGAGGQTFTRNTTTPACGVASLQISGGSSGQFAYSVRAFGATYTNIYFHVRAKISALPSEDAQFSKLMAEDSSIPAPTETNGIFKAYFTSGGKIRVVSGTGANVATLSSYSINTYYHFWGCYTTNGTGYLAFSASSVFPTNPDDFAVYTGGNTNFCGRYSAVQEGAMGTINWDTVRVRTGTVGGIDCN